MLPISSFPFSQHNLLFSFSSTVLFSSLIWSNWLVLDILIYCMKSVQIRTRKNSVFGHIWQSISCCIFVIDSSGIVAYLHQIAARNKSLFYFVKNKTICQIWKLLLFQSKVLSLTCFVQTFVSLSEVILYVYWMLRFYNILFALRFFAWFVGKDKEFTRI